MAKKKEIANITTEVKSLVVDSVEQDTLVSSIADIINSARTNIVVKVNDALLSSYWAVGKVIVEHEQLGKVKAEYGINQMATLSKRLTKKLGKGFSVSNLFNMRRFYLAYPILQTVSGKLSWSHYCELFGISDTAKRGFYEKECLNSRWSFRELRRQIESSLFERLLLSKGETNKKIVYELSQKGQIIEKPEDILKDPYVFEFLGLPENKPMPERDLENSLVKHLENFLLELGKGFMYVGRQQRITVGNKHYYVDMVFYNKILKAYVLIDLKVVALQPEHFGQMNMYVNYYNSEINDENDNPCIGILLCTDKDKAVAEYSLGGLSNNIFASKYVQYIPDRDMLIAEVEKVLSETKD
ncbi:MAG: PDDEXK nuclease domain-containing protein [Clostridiales bacterium]|jgi:predicted nuclease of restriction endonuclease-like (RecB) superfamily|nr:PDDEXK nuclease domain-containing protein [Clostridiales bacterium]